MTQLMTSLFVLLACNRVRAGQWTENDYASGDCSGAPALVTIIEERKWSAQYGGQMGTSDCHAANGIPVKWNLVCEGGMVKFKSSACSVCTACQYLGDEVYTCDEFNKLKAGQCAKNSVTGGLGSAYGSVRITSGSIGHINNPCQCSGGAAGGSSGGSSAGGSSGGSYGGGSGGGTTKKASSASRFEAYLSLVAAALVMLSMSS